LSAEPCPDDARNAAGASQTYIGGPTMPDNTDPSDLRALLVAANEVLRRLVEELISTSPNVLPDDYHVIFAEAAELRRNVRRAIEHLEES
jgi:hypothetical protein